MCIISIGRKLPFEISEIFYDMIFSTKDWRFHQLRNGLRIECRLLFLDSTNESGQVSVDEYVNEQRTTAQSPQYKDQDFLDGRSENETRLVGPPNPTFHIRVHMFYYDYNSILSPIPFRISRHPLGRCYTAMHTRPTVHENDYTDTGPQPRVHK